MSVEWLKHKEFKIKIGQFKRPFTFENPMNPIDIGFNSQAQSVLKLAGFNDRTGEQSSSGRDIGGQRAQAFTGTPQQHEVGKADVSEVQEHNV